jgi:MOSC domain-containing protein YiiM
MSERVVGGEPSWRGVLEHIHMTGGASLPMQAVGESTLVAGLGIPGDRYATRTGTYSNRHHIDRQITLIEAETLDALARDHRVVLPPNEHRRNLTTRGVALSHLVGHYFSVGPCVLYGGRLNVPCKYLEQLIERPVFRPLIHRSGLNARVIVGGTIRIGDAIEPCPPDDVDPVLRAENERNVLEAPPEVF